MIDLKVRRFLSDAETTLGVLSIDGDPFCWTLEDEHRRVKVDAETRIPAGVYRIESRTEGGMVKRYQARHAWHRGMLWLRMVPGFEWIYLHPGNSEEDTAGCILVGDAIDLRSMTLRDSVPAYQRLYQKVISAAEAGQLMIQVEDRDL